MITKSIVRAWFDKWESGDYMEIPVSEKFVHKSPFGVIQGKEEYLWIVSENEDKFPGYKYKIKDEIYDGNKACVCYNAIQGDFQLEVSEWYHIKDRLIEKINSYYHIGEIRDERKLNNQ